MTAVATATAVPLVPTWYSAYGAAPCTSSRASPDPGRIALLLRSSEKDLQEPTTRKEEKMEAKQIGEDLGAGR